MVSRSRFEVSRLATSLSRRLLDYDSFITNWAAIFPAQQENSMTILSRLHRFFFAEGIMRIGKLLIIGAAFVAAGVIIARNAVGQAQSDTVIPRVPISPLNSDLV